MKFTIHLLLIALLVALAYAATEQKQVIVSYPKDTPYSVIEHAMDAIKEAYKTLIKGFAATAPTKVVQSVKALGEKYNAIVEEDQVVSIVGTSS
ncbi:unnamed protein product [Aureobasidium pullulans]|nr:unnamed protein product [Aureobasidium pullulans]